MQPPEQRDIDELQRPEALYEASGGGVDSRVEPSDVIGDAIDDPQDMQAWVRECETRGLAELDAGLVPQVRFTPAGRQRVEEARTRRANRGLRRRACRSHLLGWTDQHSDHAEDHVNADGFAASSYGWFEGGRFAWPEIVSAAQFLHRSGLIAARFVVLAARRVRRRARAAGGDRPNA